jgi:hypothetical protein
MEAEPKEKQQENQKEAEATGKTIVKPSGNHWQTHKKYLYEAMNKKETELTIEEKRSLLSNPPILLPEKIKLYLDAEALW